MENTLYYGDNLEILRKYIPDNSIDLIYLDPPFNSKASYNILFKEPTGELSKAQITAFEDTWHWGEEAEKTFQEIIDIAPPNVADMMRAFNQFIRRNDMMAYLTMMCIRLMELKRVLKDTGSIYLHCDPTASHYLKILMDTIFDKRNFRNEIIWFYKTGGASKRHFAKKHDVIFFYTKSDRYTFNTQKEKSYMMHEYGFKKSKFFKDEKGQYTWVIIKDVWEIPSIGSADKQRLGYPTQKPENLLERIILTSSNKDDIILDPFCGCGTTIAVAQKHNRQWIGIDITHLAVNLIKWRLKSMFHLEAGKDFKVIGEPVDLEGARALASQNRYQFQWWALSLVNGRPFKDKKRGADTGIDGIAYFSDEKDVYKKILIQVKSGKVSASHIRDFAGTMEREKAEIGLFITLNNPSKNTLKEALSKGFYINKFTGEKCQRLQIFTIPELLRGKKPKILLREIPYKGAKPFEKDAEQKKIEFK